MDLTPAWTGNLYEPGTCVDVNLTQEEDIAGAGRIYDPSGKERMA